MEKKAGKAFDLGGKGELISLGADRVNWSIDGSGMANRRLNEIKIYFLDLIAIQFKYLKLQTRIFSELTVNFSY